jgi:hypothetical protein
MSHEDLQIYSRQLSQESPSNSTKWVAAGNKLRLLCLKWFFCLLNRKMTVDRMGMRHSERFSLVRDAETEHPVERSDNHNGVLNLSVPSK